MSFRKHVWDQLKNIRDVELIAALERDGWMHDETRGAVQVYRHSDGRRITVHRHSNKTYGPNLLRSLLQDIGWTEADLRRLKLIK